MKAEFTTGAEPEKILCAECGELVIKIPRIRADIARTVAAFYGVYVLDIIGHQRTAKYIKPRLVTYYLARMMTGQSTFKIAFYLGDRDHTTVMHGARRITQLMETDPFLALEIDEIKRRIEARL